MAKDETPHRERRSSRRIEASLPARFTTDQKHYMHGVITSFGNAGLFIQSEELVTRGTKVVVEAGLGRGFGELRWVAKVAYVNRRNGTHVVPGIGLSFDEPPKSVREQVDGFMDAYPGPVPLSQEGRFEWPANAHIGGTTERVRLSADPWSPVGVAALVDALEASEAERVVLAHRRKDLLPEDGIPRELLLELARASHAEATDGGGESGFDDDELVTFDAVELMLEEVEAVELVADSPESVEDASPEEASTPPDGQDSPRHAVLRTLIAQCGLVDAYEAVDWRLERLVLDPAAFLRSLEQLEALALELHGFELHEDRAWASVATVLASGLERVAPHMQSVAWHVGSTLAVEGKRARREERKVREAQDPAHAEGLERHYNWDAVRSHGRQSRRELLVGAARDFFAGRATATGVSALAQGASHSIPRWLEPCLIAAAFVILPLIGLGGWAVERFDVLGGGPGRGATAVAQMQVSETADGASRVVLASWSEGDPRSDLQLIEQVKLLAGGGYDSAEFTHRGRTVAVWRDGYVAGP